MSGPLNNEQPQGGRLEIPVPQDIANPFRLVVGIEETTATIRVSGGHVSIEIPLPNAASGNSGNAHAEQQTSSVAVPAYASIPDSFVLPFDNETYVRCPICFSRGYSRLPRATTCGHVFCGPCLEKCFLLRPHCPICGTPQEYCNSTQLFL